MSTFYPQVFELLKSLTSPSLTAFDLDNWESTIRHLVRPHPEYSDITQWPGRRETADITYNDASGNLTSILMESGYLDRSWEGLTPRYLLEVKTTTGRCSQPFYMSNVQHQRVC